MTRPDDQRHLPYLYYVFNTDQFEDRTERGIADLVTQITLNPGDPPPTLLGDPVRMIWAAAVRRPALLRRPLLAAEGGGDGRVRDAPIDKSFW